MSNGHARANCAVVRASNRIPFPLTYPLDCINLFFRKNGAAVKSNDTFFSKMAAVAGGNGWGLVINGSYNGF